ncbi:parallel beta-helix repeat protein [Marinilabilia salmonicolor]|jgi:parallel beta-helix repeat protein|uniref:right-handed parallel beta-helix repeat-containing protein n=1 Tax=Marinilabilia salmonicolor TaxID=989 RepID=UPI000D07B20E|nr:right-handed parallel beta-helix repeat-containing protein [Marinilabilia salmonicolor]PRY96631.1 parallel beta-helix repeat protein [Marinilabilia salmonicolor]
MKNKHLNLLFVPALMVAFGLVACQPPQSIEDSAGNESVYGPVEKTYDLPEVSGTIYYVSPDGNAEADGTALEAPTSIESALSRVVTGDAVVMRGGTYRSGNLIFNQGITIQPYQDEKPVLNGTLEATEWEQDENGLWFTRWDRLFPGEPESWWRPERNLEFTPLHRFNNDMVFVDGNILQSAGSKDELDEGTFFVDYDAQEIYIGQDPAGKKMEITAFRKAIFRTSGEAHGKENDGKGPVIRGLTVTQYPDTMVHIDGFYPQGHSADEAHGNDVVGTVFEDCTFSKSLRIGVFAIGDSMVMRNCKITDTNTEGLYVVASDDVLLEGNIFENNNIEKWTGFYPAAVKIFNQSHRVVCSENLIINHPHSNGLWYDVGNVDGVFVNNRVESVGSPEGPFRDDQVWPSSNGFFFEISKGVTVAGNDFVNNNQGMLILNSSGAKVYNNTFVNSRASFGRDERGSDPDHFGWHINTGPGVDERENHEFVNNLMVDTMGLEFPLLYVWQPSEMCERLNESTLQKFDNNVYVKMTKEENAAIALWSPADNEKCQTKISDPAELNELYGHFEANSKFFNGYDGALFTNVNPENLEVNSSFEGHIQASEIPENIKAAAGWSGEDAPFVGAR